MSEKQYPNTFQDAKEVHKNVVDMPEGGTDYIKDMSKKIDESSQAAKRANVGLPLLMDPNRNPSTGRPESSSQARSGRLGKIIGGVAGAGAVAYLALGGGGEAQPIEQAPDPKATVEDVFTTPDGVTHQIVDEKYSQE